MITQSRAAVYAGSFDPVTLGHMWMIKQGSSMFDKLVVAVGTNPDKSCHFSLNERIEMLQESIAGVGNVTVDKYPNKYLIKYAGSIGARFILKGIRNSIDYEYEKSISYINRDLNPDIVTVFLLPPRDMVEFSSSIVRGLIGLEGWEDIVGKYVPACVLRRLISENKSQASQI